MDTLSNLEALIELCETHLAGSTDVEIKNTNDYYNGYLEQETDYNNEDNSLGAGFNRAIKHFIKRKDTPSIKLALANSVNSSVIVTNGQGIVKHLIGKTINDSDHIMEELTLVIEYSNAEQLNGYHLGEEASLTDKGFYQQRKYPTGVASIKISSDTHSSTLKKVLFGEVLKSHRAYLSLDDRYMKEVECEIFVIVTLLDYLRAYKYSIRDGKHLNSINIVGESYKIKPFLNNVEDTLAELKGNGFDLTLIDGQNKLNYKDFNFFVKSHKFNLAKDVYLNTEGEVVTSHLKMHENGFKITPIRDYSTNIGFSGMIREYFKYSESLIDNYGFDIGNGIQVSLLEYYEEEDGLLNISLVTDILEEENLMRKLKSGNIELAMVKLERRTFLDYIPSSIKENLGTLNFDNLMTGNNMVELINSDSKLLFVEEFPHHQKEVLEVVRNIDEGFSSNNLYVMYKHSLTHYGKSLVDAKSAKESVEEFGKAGNHAAIKLAKLIDVTDTLLTTFNRANKTDGEIGEDSTKIKPISDDFREVD